MLKADGCMSVVNDEKKPPLSPKPLNNITTRKTSDVNAKSYQLLNERLNEQDELIRNLIADVKEKNGRILDLEQRLLKVEAEQVKIHEKIFGGSQGRCVRAQREIRQVEGSCSEDHRSRKLGNFYGGCRQVSPQ